MNLNVKKKRFSAGRSVVVVNLKDAGLIQVHAGERVEIKYKGKKFVSVCDVSKNLVKNGDVIISNEFAKTINLGKGKRIEVNVAPSPKSLPFIMKKMKGLELDKKEIREIIKDIVRNLLTEPEIAYFVSGVANEGMSNKETIYLTEAIFKEGKKISWNKKVADKHSIGGIAGNRTTPLVVSICATAGVTIPKTSSRAITSSAGTADVIEAVAKVDFNDKEIKSIVKKTNGCFVWGGAIGLAPADDKLIRIEKVLKVDPPSQLIASIIAKKLSVGAKYVLIDIPYGNGAKVSKNEGRKLRKKFLKVGKHFGLEMKVVLTDGSQPIGNGIGPSLEIRDIISILKRDEDRPLDLEEKSVMLSSKLIELSGKYKNGLKKAREILESGQALRKFEEIIKAQKGSLKKLKWSKFKKEIKVSKNSKVNFLDNKKLNTLGRILGSPKDKAAGIYLCKHKGDKVRKGECFIRLHSESKLKLKNAIDFVKREKPIMFS